MTKKHLEKLQGVCKDCGNGTCNNDFDPAFELQEDGDCQYVVCLYCGSTHVDILRF
jgi:hypothetical protein